MVAPSEVEFELKRHYSVVNKKEENITYIWTAYCKDLCDQLVFFRYCFSYELSNVYCMKVVMETRKLRWRCICIQRPWWRSIDQSNDSFILFDIYKVMWKFCVKSNLWTERMEPILQQWLAVFKTNYLSQILLSLLLFVYFKVGISTIHHLTKLLSLEQEKVGCNAMKAN